MRRPLLAASALVACLALAGWDAPGHRAVTVVAFDRLAERVATSWLGDHDLRAQVAFQSNEPDRYRGVPSAVLAHENGPDHYMDTELLERHGLMLRTLPRLRYEFVAQLARTPTEPPAAQGTDGAPARRGVDHRTFTDDLGFVPYAIMEHHAKLVSAFNTLRIIEGLADPARANQLAAARANVLHEMGQLSHFVGDAAQPLHTTIHHHGWIGANPQGFTTDRGFHAYIDGEIVAIHRITEAEIAEAAKEPRAITDAGLWDEVIALVERSHAAVEPLYAMQKDGSLREAKGRALILERLADAAATLAGIYEAAWTSSEPTERQVKDFLRFDGSTPTTGAATDAQPDSKPVIKPEVKPDTKRDTKPDTKPDIQPISPSAAPTGTPPAAPLKAP